MSDLTIKILEDIKKNPHKKPAYLKALLDMGVLDKRAVKLSKVESKQLNDILKRGSIVIIK